MTSFLAYVWVPGSDVPGVLRRFVDRYVAAEQPVYQRPLAALLRTYVDLDPAEGDEAELADARRNPEAVHGFSIYLRGAVHDEAIITLTEESDLVLGLGIDDRDESPEAWDEAVHLLDHLMGEFDAVSGMAGGDWVRPPQSALAWVDEEPDLRVGRDLRPLIEPPSSHSP
ncbi:hypothetical protein [Cellulomonas cellasea]|uniref:Uncharacterized protein n=1 Tax=Cellulomonas cellasea TaxID=43670 RepID=A0A7W4YC00_9CELL|nr:hypothetical protein [Cellulomonas cellasea]MBB2924490.1 hypothetical protein [Cellulomonas cellasea]